MKRKTKKIYVYTLTHEEMHAVYQILAHSSEIDHKNTHKLTQTEISLMGHLYNSCCELGEFEHVN